MRPLEPAYLRSNPSRLRGSTSVLELALAFWKYAGCTETMQRSDMHKTLRPTPGMQKTLFKVGWYYYFFYVVLWEGRSRKVSPRDLSNHKDSMPCGKIIGSGHC